MADGMEEEEAKARSKLMDEDEDAATFALDIAAELVYERQVTSCHPGMLSLAADHFDEEPHPSSKRGQGDSW